MTDAPADHVDDGTPVPQNQSETHALCLSSQAEEHQTTEPEDLDITIIADTTLTNDFSLHGVTSTRRKNDSSASFTHSRTSATEPEPSGNPNDTNERDNFQPCSNNELPSDSDLYGGDVTVVEGKNVPDGKWPSKSQDKNVGDKNNTEPDETLQDGSGIDSPSSFARSHPTRPGGMQLNLKPPSPQPWDVATTDDSHPSKTIGLSIPVSAARYSPVASHTFSAMQTTAGNGRRLLPKSSYYYGPPPSDSAYGTPPVGQIGVHHPREILRIERDYTGGEIIQFAPIYPLELENRLTPTQFLESINTINEKLIAAHSMRHAFLDNLVTVATLQLSRLFLSTHYQKEMKRLQHTIDDLNAMLFNPVGLNILWPGDVAFLYLEIEYY